MGDRVFREGAGGLELVGDFDGLYADEADPWGQSGAHGHMAAYYARARANLGAVIGSRVGSALEVGCGHGHVTAFLAAGTRLRWLGMDISRLAIERARELHPHLSFVVGDIRRPALGGSFDLVLLNQVLWYVLPEIDAAIAGCLSLLRPGGTLVVAQAYLKGEQRFAAEIANGFAGAVDLFNSRFSDRLHLVEGRYDSNPSLAHNDGILVFQA